MGLEGEKQEKKIKWWGIAAVLSRENGQHFSTQNLLQEREEQEE